MTESKIEGAMQRRPKNDLTGSQRKHLRGEAHHLDPLVRVGREGITLGIADAVNDALEAHELIKVRVLEGAPLKRAEAADALALACGAHVVGQVGRVVILYRRHPTKPQIALR